MLTRTKTLPSASQSLSDAAGSLQAAAHSVQLAATEKYNSAKESLTTTRDNAQAYVHENPWRIAGAAAGLGLLAGMLLSRRP
jgi:ElaB/YqjD/DUF883 family membrane-anchored ribosome-binding protein